MIKKVLVEGPFLTRSGYGEHARLVLRALRDRKDIEIYASPLEWGRTNWISDSDPERIWMDELVKKTVLYGQEPHGAAYDVHIHVGIPNEYQKKAPYGVCVTAGIETTRVADEWIKKTNEIDKIIVPSNFAKFGFENTEIKETNRETGEQKTLTCQSELAVVPYPAKEISPSKEFKLDLPTKFNFLVVAQWSTRKNIENTIRWFVEEFSNDSDVGLVVKANMTKNSIMDRYATDILMKNTLEQYPDKKCKVYLLHGELSESEMTSLYTHSKIKAIVSASHGEGYGLPLFEAAYNGLPVVAPDWSGHVDFLYGPSRKGKNNKRMFQAIDYDLAPVQEHAAWENILTKNSQWCYPREESYKKSIRLVFEEHQKYRASAKKLQNHIKETYKYEQILSKMSNELLQPQEIPEAEYVFVSDLFAHQYIGGAEMSLQALIDKCPGAAIGINCQAVSRSIVELYRQSKWVFGNQTNLNEDVYQALIDNNIEYSFIEFDYKLCKHRNPLLYELLEGESCDYESTRLGNIVKQFMLNANSVFFMSKAQRDIYTDLLPGIQLTSNYILSSIFDDTFFATIEEVKEENHEGEKSGWVVLGSDSWVKGTAESEDWCRTNNIEYEVVSGLNPRSFLEKLHKAEGVCFHPSGYDTCPRFIIEAKLLECKLELNENVQHRHEEWFNLEKEDMIVYLKSRPSYFWSKAF